MSNNYEDYQRAQPLYCARCRLKPAIYSCTRCEPYVNFCIQCDTYVHSMSSKKNHIRNVIGDIKSTINNEILKEQEYKNGYDQKLNESVNNQYTLNLSKYLTRKDNKSQRNNSTNLSLNHLSKEREKLNNLSFERPKLSTSPYRTIEEPRKTFNNTNENFERTNNLNNEDLNRGYNSTSNLLGTNSKDYLNEIKNLYDREKRDLLFRNSSLQSNLDFTKSTLNDKIKTLEFELDETTKRNTLNCQIMEDEFNLQLKLALKEKDLEIKSYILKLEDVERSNKELIEKLNESLKENSDVKNYYKNILSNMEYEYKEKNKEYLELKVSFEEKLNFYTRNFEEEKLKLIRNYEDNYDEMVRAHKESKEKLNSIIYQRELDLKNLMEKNRDEEIKYQANLNDLRKDIKFRINENESLRIKTSQLQNEIEILQRVIDQGKKEANKTLKEIKLLETENRMKNQENKELKLSTEKLSGIVYGKFNNSNRNNASSSKNFKMQKSSRSKSPK